MSRDLHVGMQVVVLNHLPATIVGEDGHSGQYMVRFDAPNLIDCWYQPHAIRPDVVRMREEKIKAVMR